MKAWWALHFGNAHTNSYTHSSIPDCYCKTSYILFDTKTWAVDRRRGNEGDEREKQERTDRREKKNHDRFNNSHVFCFTQSCNPFLHVFSPDLNFVALIQQHFTHLLLLNAFIRAALASPRHLLTHLLSFSAVLISLLRFPVSSSSSLCLPATSSPLSSTWT